MSSFDEELDKATEDYRSIRRAHNRALLWAVIMSFTFLGYVIFFSQGWIPSAVYLVGMCGSFVAACLLSQLLLSISKRYYSLTDTYVKMHRSL